MRVGTFREPGGTPFVGEVCDGEVMPLAAPSMLAWLAGEHGRLARDPVPLAELETLAPVPEPPSVRDFYAFERHVAAGWRRRGGEVPEAWYDAPAFYFSNPAAILGPGEPVSRPAATVMLDFELEIAAVVGAGGEVAGFALLNDWSARDVQAREVTIGLGPHKAKDFATSLGPYLVTPDALPFRDGRLELEATVEVNGDVVATCDASEQHFAWPELVAHAARDTRVRAGDVLGSGTLSGGCLLELGPLREGGRERWLEPGDRVTLRAPGLGELTNTIV